MILKKRPYRGQSDWYAIADLIQSDTLFYHRIDFPWRLCSTSLQEHQNAMIWEDEQGRMQVFTALQFPWLTVDYAIHPDARSSALETEIIHWAETRLNQIATETNTHFPFNISALAEEHERVQF